MKDYSVSLFAIVFLLGVLVGSTVMNSITVMHISATLDRIAAPYGSEP